MKDNKEYSKRLQQLYRTLKRRYPKVERVFYDEPLEAVIYAIVSENVSTAEAQSAIKRLRDYFVDLNDLRVSRTGEITEALGSDTQAARDTASALLTVLQAVFGEYNTLSLAVLKKIGKRQARKKLEQIETMSVFAVDYCVLTSLKGHAVPLTKKMVDYLRNNELVAPKAGERQIESFLARQVRSEKAYEFYALLRRASESDKGRIKKTGRKTKKKKTETTRKRGN